MSENYESITLMYMLVEMAVNAAERRPAKTYYWQCSDEKMSKIIQCDMIRQRFTTEEFYEISFRQALEEKRLYLLEDD